MANPTFNGFSLNDANFIAERIEFKGYASRDAIRAKINRREGIKLLGNQFGEKEVTIEGQIIGSSVANLQSLLDSMKTSFTEVEGDLVLESNRTFQATVLNLVVPDEHYNQTKAPFQVTFICSNPYAEGSSLSVSTPVVSGTFTFSGSVNISGSFFNRPTIIYTPAGAAVGNTNIKSFNLYHVPTGQTITITGFGSGLGLGYQNPVTINLDTFISLEGTSEIDNSGAFPKWNPGVNQFTITVSGRFPGGSVQVNYNPRYL